MHLDAAPSLLCPGGWVPVLGSACNAVTGGVASAASGAASSVLGAGVGAAFDAAGQWVASGALWLLDEVGRAMSSSTSIGLGTNWFSTHESVVAAIAASMILPMAFVGVIQAIYRQNAAVLTRTFLVHLPLALLLTGAVIELVRLGLAITDSLSGKVLEAGGVDTRHLLAPVTGFLSPASPTVAGVPQFVVFVFALIVAVATLILWLELVVRSAAIAAAVLFMPLALAALVWPAVSHWCKRLAETLAALVLSKFVIAAVISLAVGAIAGGLGTEGPNGGGFAVVVTGIALLVIAAVSPFSLLKLVPAVEAGAIAHLESVRHRVASAARAPLHAKNFALDVAAAAGSGGTSAVAAAAGAETLLADSGSSASSHGASESSGVNLREGNRLPSPLGEWFETADTANRSNSKQQGDVDVSGGSSGEPRR